MVDGIADLERGRECFARRRWADAFAALAAADDREPLAADDLELLAISAYMLGRDDGFVGALERAHHAYLAAGAAPRAARCTWWIGHNLLFRGEPARAAGWWGRGQRIVEERDCVERGYLLIPELIQHTFRGDCDAAYVTASEAAGLAERFADADLLAIARHEQAHALVRQGHAEEGFRLLDEVMVAVVSDELSPIVTGLVYCNTIVFCHSVYEIGRAREWTDALARWWAQQPDMVAHTGMCQVHRAELMQLEGAWGAALDEARRAGERFAQGVLNQLAAGRACYREGELHRLRGDFAAAEAAYREASRRGREPQPGLALLRVAQGNHLAAAAALRRAVDETTAPMKRAGLLPAFVEVLLATGDVDGARAACDELEEITAPITSDLLGAISAQARGAVALAAGDARGALVLLRDALRVWRELEAPYEIARTRTLVGLACRSLGDEDTAALELEAAHGAFAQLGAAPDLDRVESLLHRPAPPAPHGLTARELQVLRLVASGRTNREIAAELVLSEKTVDRHLSNILAKLRVPSRTAATAYAYRHGLL